MPIPRAVARFNKRVSNHILAPLAARLPWFGILTHIGRKTHRPYRTPVNVFRRGDRYTFALTYGVAADWVKNVLAAGGCTLETRGQTVRLTSPRLVHDERRRAVPAPVRVVLRLIGVDDFLELERDASQSC